MRVVISPARGAGKIKAPPSKSVAHRLLICAALSEGKSVIHDVSDCEDVEATLDCMAALGIKFERKENDVTVFGVNPKRIKPTGTLPCRESGSTLRFFIPILLISGRCAMLSGAPSLLSRPMTVYEDICKKMDYAYISDGKSIAVKGPLRGGEYSVVGNVSSQFISGLLFALPTLSESSRIRIAPPIESRSYIDLTVDALSKFGVRVIWEDEHTLYIEGGQKYTPTELSVEGDYSGAAFYLAAGAIGPSPVTLTHLDTNSPQGDREILSLLRRFGAHVEETEGGIRVSPAPLSGITINASQIPDLVPILAVVAAAAYGETRIENAARLRLKESDRIETVHRLIETLGGDISEGEDFLVIRGSGRLRGGTVSAENDHRIAMSAAVASLVSDEPVTILGAECAEKSYPRFYDDAKALGFSVTVI